MKVGDLVKNTYIEKTRYNLALTRGIVISDDKVVSWGGTGYYEVLLLSGSITRWYQKEIEVISESR